MTQMSHKSSAGKNTHPTLNVLDVRFLICQGDKPHNIQCTKAGTARCERCRRTWADLDEEMRAKATRGGVNGNVSTERKRK